MKSFETIPYFTQVIQNAHVMEELLMRGGNEFSDHAEEEADEDFETMVAQGQYGDTDGEGMSDEDSRCDLPAPGFGSGVDFGTNLKFLWNKRKDHLVSDFCIAGWLLSPLEDVMEDVKESRSGVSDVAMDRLLKKMYHNLKEDEMGKVMDKFWTEFDSFSNKRGVFGEDRKYIWNSDLIRKRRSAKWHAQYSVPYTEVSRLSVSFLLVFFVFLTSLFLLFCLQVLGKVACRVLSTLLGIGVAERSWGAVKHLKSGSRSHLGSDTTRMQATIFGAACIDKARIVKKDNEKDTKLWNDEDEEFQLGLENFSLEEAGEATRTASRNPRRLFHCWMEEWEDVSSRTNDVVHEVKLLRKYGGLRWLDPDSNAMFVAEKDNMEWQRGLGWCVIGLREDGENEAWPIYLLPSLIKKTQQETVLNVEFVHPTAEEKAARRAAREAMKGKSVGKAKKNNGKRKRGDDIDYDFDSSDDDEDAVVLKPVQKRKK